MISKKRSNDYNYVGLQMLCRRLPDRHVIKNVIQSKMLSAKAGIIGETTIEKVFETYQFSFPCRVLHDISLNSNGKFQIDTLLFSPHFAVIFEFKNIVGEFKFEGDPACLRRTLENGQEDIIRES
ncbi:nuclease-related domain-containing protein [Psychrobacillus sp.]|uniref:nuclease-related domain-containing protein n=1 Tax=Psychrobacillus sp. TaxID=1871623 RepID=UPI0028BD9D8C|nr:nuclease-related domain-containing protein [Psychrobacillus sp.]